MDDLTNMLSQVLSDPAAMQQIQSMAASLGLMGGGQEGPAPASVPALPPPAPAPGGAAGGPDLSALASMLGDALKQTGGTPPAPPPPMAPTASAGAGGGVDLSALASLLGGVAGTAGPAPPPQPAGGLDLSALSGLMGGLGLGGGQPAQSPQKGADLSGLTALLGGVPKGQSGGGGLPFDMNMLLKLQGAMSSLSANKANVELLMALKPRLKADRAKKVDDAVRVMQLIQFLPLIKESGLFGDMDNFLGGLGTGGLGGIVSGIGDGIGGLLGNLLGGRRQQ